MGWFLRREGVGQVDRRGVTDGMEGNGPGPKQRKNHSEFMGWLVSKPIPRLVAIETGYLTLAAIPVW